MSEELLSRQSSASALGLVEGRPWYREESWLAVGLVSLLVGLLAFVVPTVLRHPMFAVSLTLAAVSLVMMFLRERQRGKTE
jgi:hypothetical protein